MPSYPLTASHVDVTVGLPAGVHPIALLGGDHARWYVKWEDGAAVALGIFAAWVAFRTRARRALGGVVMGGLWFLSAPVYVLVMGVFGAVGGLWLLGRLVRRKYFAAAGVALVGAAALGCAALATLPLGIHPVSPVASAGMSEDRRPITVDLRMGQINDRQAQLKTTLAEGEAARSGNFAAQVAGGGVAQGVTPWRSRSPPMTTASPRRASS